MCVHASRVGESESIRNYLRVLFTDPNVFQHLRRPFARSRWSDVDRTNDHDERVRFLSLTD